MVKTTQDTSNNIQNRPVYTLTVLAMVFCTLDVIVMEPKEAITLMMISTAVFGMNVVLCASCLYFLNTDKGHVESSPSKIITFHLYILAMLGFATQAAVNISQFASDAGFNPLSESFPCDVMTPRPMLPNKRYQQLSAISVPFTILGADAFMVCIGLVT